MIIQIASFFRRCDIDDKKDLSYHLIWWKKIVRVIQIFALFFPISVVLSTLIAVFVSNIIGAPIETLHETEQGMYQIVSINEAIQNSLELAVLGIIAAPIFEELLFRSPLRFRFKWLFGIVGWFISQRLMDIHVYRNFWLSFESSYPLIVHIGAPLIIPLLLIGLGIYIGDVMVKKVSICKEYEYRIGEFIRSKRSIFIILSSFLFGLIHVTKFILGPDGFVSIPASVIVFLPLLLLPQIVSGFELAFVRLKYGLPMAIFSHALANVFAALPASFIALMHVVPEKAVDLFLEHRRIPDGVDLYAMYIALTGSIVSSSIVLGIIGIVIIGWVYSIVEYVQYKKVMKK